jgi:hypothetical protein
VAQNNLAVTYFYNKDYQAAKKHADKAKQLGYEVDQRFIDAISSALA